MNRRNKKGISPLIATVLIIGFTIVLAAMVITWGTKLFKQTTEETGRASQFNLLCTTGYSVEYRIKVPQSGAYEIVAINKNEKSMGGFLFLVKDATGTNSQPFSTDTTLVPGGIVNLPAGSTDASLSAFATKVYTIRPPAGTWKKIEVRPIALLDNNEKKVCDNEVVLNLP